MPFQTAASAVPLRCLHQRLACHPQVDQCEQRRHLRAVLRQSLVAHLHVVELPLEHPERMLHRRTDRGLGMLQLLGDVDGLHHAALGGNPELPAALRCALLRSDVAGVAEHVPFCNDPVISCSGATFSRRAR